jgi:hypothetical protein
VPKKRPAAAFIARRLLLFASKQGPCIYPAVRRPSSTCVRRDRRRTAGHLGADEYGAVRRCGLRSEGGSVKGTNGPDLEAVGSDPARTLRRARLPERGAWRRNVRQLAGALAAL